MSFSALIAATLFAATLFAVALSSLPASAQSTRNGFFLNDLCRNSQTICQGYISAVYDVMAGHGYLYGFRACMPGAFNDGQLTEIVLNWLAVRPVMRPLPAPQIVVRGLAETFPCR